MVEETKFTCRKCGHVWYVSKMDEAGKAAHQCTACTSPCFFFLLSPYYKDIYTDRCPQCGSRDITRELVKYEAKSVSNEDKTKITLFQKTAIQILNFYQKKISPILNQKGIKCRFIPSCSNYSKMAFLKYGFLKGTFLTIGRLLRCNPYNSGSHIDYP